MSFITSLVSQREPEIRVTVDINPLKEEPKVEEDYAFVLTRNSATVDGIFSTMTDKSGKVISMTLEHAYSNPAGGFAPKLYNGIFTCVRGPHRLHNMTEDFSTFEITGVTGHEGILFHWGCYNKDSDGCVLMGQEDIQSDGVEMVDNSRATFAKFMNSMEGIDTFKIKVVG